MKTVKTTLIAIALFAAATPTMASETNTDLSAKLASAISAQVVEITQSMQADLQNSLKSAAVEFVATASEAITADTQTTENAENAVQSGKSNTIAK